MSPIVHRNRADTRIEFFLGESCFEDSSSEYLMYDVDISWCSNSLQMRDGHTWSGEKCEGAQSPYYTYIYE